MRFQSTPSLRKATVPSATFFGAMIISIHTFLAEGDVITNLRFPTQVAFQSTPSLRKATWQDGSVCIAQHISIHTFLAEGDSKYKSNYK